MHGLGNDFVVFEGPLELRKKQVAQLCDRHTGVGADGVMIVSGIDEKKVKMEYWNSDGSAGEMCGNGLRCVARYAVENELVAPGNFTVETPAGSLQVVWDGQDPNEIEVQVGKVVNNQETVELCGYDFHTADVGNPHAITFVDNVGPIDVTDDGPKVETDPHFPNKTNVEFAQIKDGEIIIKIWERGSGETLACGTGMVSTAIIARDLGKIELPVTVHAPGGAARISLDEDGYARMIGPAEISFSGELHIQ